jgi:1-deoxy-D-xylulose-5-phosphate reductoisomerase
MKGPISFALNHPHRVPGATKPIDWSTSHTWSFTPIDESRFPAIALARTCGEIGGGLPAIFNASNEVGVQAFINGEISFTAIIDLVSLTVDKFKSSGAQKLRDLSDVSAVEEDARRIALENVKKVSA